jgi:Ran GTPase-activating protein (RanGAP) involved in mRNA processing and transport
LEPRKIPLLRYFLTSQIRCFSACGTKIPLLFLVCFRSPSLADSKKTWEEGRANEKFSAWKIFFRLIFRLIFRYSVTFGDRGPAFPDFPLLTFRIPHSRVWNEHTNCCCSFTKPEPCAMRTLSLEYESIGKEGALVLAAMLPAASALTTIRLAHNNIDDKGVRDIATALLTTTTLTYLDLRSNKFGDEGATALAAALKWNVLTFIDLSFNNIGNAGALALAFALSGNTTLTSIDLSGNKIDHEGGRTLAVALKGNNTVTALDLSHNTLGDDGVCALVEALKGNTTLTDLDLSSNAIGPAGARVLAEILSSNNGLTHLRLHHNAMGDEGACRLALALQKNTTLRNINLGGNQIGTAGFCALATALAVNTHLTAIDVSFNVLEEEGIHALAQALKRNRTLKLCAVVHWGVLDEDAKSFRTKIMTDVLESNVTLRFLVGVDGVDHLLERNGHRRICRAKVTWPLRPSFVLLTPLQCRHVCVALLGLRRRTVGHPWREVASWSCLCSVAFLLFLLQWAANKDVVTMLAKMVWGTKVQGLAWFHFCVLF